jgi:hypothetical protein
VRAGCVGVSDDGEPVDLEPKAGMSIESDLH